MINFIRSSMVRVMLKPAAVLTGVGSVTSYGSTFHDLRGTLPVSGNYYDRKISDINGVVWHHSATSGQPIKSIAQFHVEFRGWPGIAYHYGIDESGVVYIFNGPEKLTYHSKGYNKNNIGVVLIGNFEEKELPDKMLNSAIELNKYLKDEFNLKHAWLHNQTKATACPGKNASKKLKPHLYGNLPRK